jgi:TPR repeat protein
MYANGRGVSRNNAEAANWYGKAAEKGHKKAKDQLDAMNMHRAKSPAKKAG